MKKIVLFIFCLILIGEGVTAIFYWQSYTAHNPVPISDNSHSQISPVEPSSSQLISSAQTTPKVLLIEYGPRNKKVVALTFDADMTPHMKEELKQGQVKSWYDAQITQILEKEKVPATFFITGMWAELYPEEVKKFSQNSLFEIGNHSYDHAAFKMPCYGLGETNDKKMEVMKTQQILEKLTGKAPTYFRFPGGCFAQKDLELVQSLGAETVGWDVISGDAYLKDPHKIVEQVLRQAQNGSIIVMHLHGGPHAPATSAALDDIITGLRKKGFGFATVSGLLK